MAERSCYTSSNSFSVKEANTNAPDNIGRDEAEAETEKLVAKLATLQELQFAASNKALLIVLQGMDTSGKDGTIRCLLQSLNSTSTRVASFKVPTPEEMSHDFLWRVHKQTPGIGDTVIFNRSHYEDVLVVRVHEFVPEKVWAQRYEQINQFEELIESRGTIILKFFLHISKKEQEKRLLEREQEDIKAWKLSAGDWKEREYWDAYQDAYQDAIRKCASKAAPWHIIPADQKWYRNLLVLQAVIKSLKPYEDEWKSVLSDLGEKQKRELAEYRASRPS